MSFIPLRALGWCAPVVEVVPALPRRLSDPTGDAITHHLTDRGLWRFGTAMELTRDGTRLSIRIFLPECRQSDRADSHVEAHEMKTALVETLSLEGFVVKFSDALWTERGHRGWAVVAKATGRG